MKKLYFFLLIFILFNILTLCPLSNAVTIMSLDFGSESMKIAIVAPGIPMEIALNHESKRKTPTAVSFRGGERTYGEDAINVGTKAPNASFIYFTDLLGKKTDNPIVKLYKERFPYYSIEPDPERGTVVFKYSLNSTFTLEEIVAQVLNYARMLAADHTNQPIKELVIIVPPFFGQAERRVLLQASELAGLKVLSLMSSNAAVALNYGMFRRKEINETAHNILFYDMGASSTTATVASYQTVKTKDRGFTETNPQVTILGTGFDRTLGGLEMQLRVRDFLARKFNDMKKTNKNVFDSPRAMGKLMKAAAKTKSVLSANADYICQVEGVLDDIDFSIKITRQEFEDLCSDLFELVRNPFDEALVAAAIDISDIHQLIIVGGNTRIPKIQSILQDIWGKELGKNINADEAGALGAVYRAADLGQGFKVMKFHVKESVIYPIEVVFERLADSEDGTRVTRSIKRSLFALANQFPQKKVMTFNKHSDDFDFYVNYGEQTHLHKLQKSSIGSRNISHVFVHGVGDAFKKHLSEGAEPKGIKAHFAMDESGLLLITGIEATFEKNVTVEIEETEKQEDESTLSKLGSTISKLFSGSEDEPANETTTNANTTEEKKDEPNEKEETKAEKKKEKELKPKLVVLREELNFTIEYLDIPDMSLEQIKASKEKLREINAHEKAKHDKEKAKNTLESYILEVNDKLTQEEYEAASKEEVREQIRSLAMQLDDWLYEDGFDEEPSVYKEKLKSLEKLFEPIRKRVKIHQERPEALKAINDMLNASSVFLHAAIEAPPDHKWFSDVEIKTLDELIISTQKWIEEKEELQAQTRLYEDPKLTPMDIGDKMADLDREIKYMLNKAKLAKAKKEREEAEAKAKAEKEAKEAEKLKKENETAEKEKEESETIEESAPSEDDATPGEEEKAESVSQGENSRLEPPLPIDVEESKETSQENDEEADRRKDSKEDLDKSRGDSSHGEL